MAFGRESTLLAFNNKLKIKIMKKGFTLIELLVVIAIIGILSSVVLASLNTARERGGDAAAKASLNNARAQAELYRDTQPTPTYAGVCAATAANNGIAGLVASADNAVTATTTCVNAATGWGAEIKLDSADSLYYCVDSEGFAGELTTSAALTASNLTCQ